MKAMWLYLLILREEWGQKLILGLVVLGLIILSLLIRTCVDVKKEAVPKKVLEVKVKQVVVKKDSLKNKLKDIKNEKNRAIKHIDEFSDDELCDSLEKAFGGK